MPQNLLMIALLLKTCSICLQLRDSKNFILLTYLIIYLWCHNSCAVTYLISCDSFNNPFSTIQVDGQKYFHFTDKKAKAQRSDATIFGNLDTLTSNSYAFPMDNVFVNNLQTKNYNRYAGICYNPYHCTTPHSLDSSEGPCTFSSLHSVL